DEAETVSEQAWLQLVPTVREENSEIWATWNPVSKQSAVHKRYRINQHKAEELRLKIVELNWRDNPWFPKVLNEERINDKKFR
ncbi:phage terminase large subunit, partial [Escherichia coli]|uniref:phage terminase large subunit n=1 Tax=Escherichia coli TaxID=562 RepID=UPI001F403857